MTRLHVLSGSGVLACLAALTLPAVAPAAITELGQLPEGVSASCPASCNAVSHTTGYQAKVGPDRTVYQAPADGRIVAWTIALAKPGPTQTAYFTKRLGAPEAAVVVLAAEKKLVRRVVAKAPLQRLTDYLGQTVQFPLDRNLVVKKGQYVGLTVPSWAPALQVGVGSDSSWRASRTKQQCPDPNITSIQTSLLGRRTAAEFGCLYRTTRLTFSATFIPSPTVAGS